MSNKITTGVVRFSFPRVFTPEARNEGDKEKYSIVLLIPKDDAATVAAIEKAIEAAFREGIATTFKGKEPKNWKTPLRDGDTDRDDYEEFTGCYFINASTVRKPTVVDANTQLILDPSEIYSGCYGRVSLNFYTYDFQGNKGVGAGLNNVQKISDGERLGGDGGSSAADDFAQPVV
jgi:hypothetical protein